MITKEQLKEELDGLEDTLVLNQVHQLIQKLKLSLVTGDNTQKSNLQEQQQAMNDFFGMHKELGIDSVEEELRLIRQGRRGLFNDI